MKTETRAKKLCKKFTVRTVKTRLVRGPRLFLSFLGEAPFRNLNKGMGRRKRSKELHEGKLTKLNKNFMKLVSR